MSKILVVGELNVDMILTGLPSMPILGRELTCTDFRLVLGSSSAITAVRLAALGATVDFAGIVGNDEFGNFIRQALETAGVGTEHVETVGISTGVTIALSFQKDRALLTYLGTIAAYEGHNISAKMLADFHHLHVGAFFLQENLQAKLPTLFRMAHDTGLSTSLDVGWDPTEKWSTNPYLAATLAETDYFFPNESEADALIGDSNLEALVSKTAKLLLVKRGAEGASAYDKQGKHLHASAIPVEVVDTTGAGDAFNAGFIYAHRLLGKTIEDSLAFAVGCGSQAVLHAGGATAAPKAEEIWQLIEQNQR